ncbi:MAG: hypothetical protein ACE3JK_15005 [Sporolactobacillus sp.]
MKTMNYQVIAGIVLVFLLVAGFGAARQATSPNRVLEKAEQSIQSNHPAELKNILVSRKGIVIGEKEAEGMIRYLRQHPKTWKTLKKDLQGQVDRSVYHSDNVLSLTKESGKPSLFSRYKIYVRPQRIQVTGQESGDKVELIADGRMIQPQKKANHFEPVFPGSYPLQKKVVNDLGFFTKKQSLTVWNRPVTVSVHTLNWVQSDAATQKSVLTAVNQFNTEVSVWETTEYDPTVLQAATENFSRNQSIQRNIQFRKVRAQLAEIKSAYLGMIVDQSSFACTHFGKWRATVDTVIRYQYGYRMKKSDKYYDASYQRGVTYGLEYDRAERRWLVSGFNANGITRAGAESWSHRKVIDNPQVKVQIWKPDGTSL